MWHTLLPRRKSYISPLIFFFFLLFFDGYYPQHTLHTQKLWSITPIQCLTCPRNTEGEKKKCLTAVACFTKLHFFLKLTFFYDCTASYTTKESFQLEREKNPTQKPPRSLASPSERKRKQEKKKRRRHKASLLQINRNLHRSRKSHKQQTAWVSFLLLHLQAEEQGLSSSFSSSQVFYSVPPIQMYKGHKREPMSLALFICQEKHVMKKKKEKHNEVTLCTGSKEKKKRGMASVRNGSGPSQMFPQGWAGVPKSRLPSPACRLASKDWAQVVVGSRFEKGRRKTTRLKGVLKDGGNCEDGN